MMNTTHKLGAKFTILSLCIYIVLFAACVQGVSYPLGSVYRPFSADSPWNSRPVNPVLDDTKTVPQSDYFPAIGEGMYSTGVFIASKGDTPKTIYGPSSTTGIGIADIGGTTTSVTVPRWPSNTLPASGSDGHCEIYDPIDKIIHSFWQLKSVNGTWRATLYGWSALDGVGWGNPAYFYQGARATGVPSSAGLIRTFEVDDGDSMFRHALTLSMTFNGLSSDPTYVFPATAADGNAASSNYGSIPEGSLLMLPSTFNVTKLLTVPKLRKIAETLKTYGAYVTDRNTGTPFNIYVEIGSNYTLHPGGWSNTAAAQLQVIRAALRPVKSCSGYLNGEDKLINFNLNQNLLSMRGPWVKDYGDTLGYFDTWRQAVVFSNRTTKTSQRNTNGTGLSKVSWARFIPGMLYNITAITTGGGQFRYFVNMACRNQSNIDSGYLNNGESFVFAWPAASCWGGITAVSGVNQESTVSVQMLRVEVPAVASVNPTSSLTSGVNATNPSNSTRNVNGGQLVTYPNVVMVVLLAVLSFFTL